MRSLDLLRRVKRLWAGSIRRQLTWSFALVSLLAVLASGLFVYQHQRSFLYKQGVAQARNLAQSLAVSSSSWLVANDLAGLQEVTQGFADTDDLKFAAVVSRRGEVLASTQAGQVGRYFTDDVSQRMLRAPPQPLELVSQDNLIDVAVPIRSGQRHVGWARIEMSQATANENLQHLTFVGLVFAVVAAVVAELLAWRLSRPLGELVRVVGDVVEGGSSLRAPVANSDEIGRLARDFNRMLDVLEAQQAHLAQRNTELAMYNQVLQRIGQGEPLPAVLEQLALQIENLTAGTLCVVSMLDREGRRLQVVAAPSVPQRLREALDRLPVGVGRPSAGVAAKLGVRVVTLSIEEDASSEPLRALAHEHGVRSSWSQPVRDSAYRVLGVLTLLRRKLGAPLEGEVQLIERCAQLAGLAMERHWQEEGQRIAATAFESQQGMYIMDADRRILRVNRAFTEITGFAADEVIGQPAAILRSGDEDPATFEAMWHSVAQTGTWQGEINNRRKDGTRYPKWLSLTAVRDRAGAISHYVAGFFDVTQRKLAEAEIERLAFYDPLTGLPNRRLLLDRLQLNLAACQRKRQHGALLFLDLDNFKALNDTLGHDKGDELLRQVGRRLSEHVRTSDTVARLGGDEFVVMLDDLNAALPEAAREVEAIGDKLLDMLRQPYDLGGTPYHSSASIGVALFGSEGVTLEELLKRADLALYQAKSVGRNTLRFFDPEMQAAVTARMALESDLRVGLQQEQFWLAYQAQIDGVGRMTGAEVLLRWQHPQRGLVSPAQFIPLAEETGLILPLGRWVLAQACQQLARWASEPGTAHLTLSVNVSARQLRQADFVREVLQLLQAAGAPAGRLKLELTESLLLENVEDCIAKMSELKAHGVGFSLDDFGTGYSSLSYLKRLPLDQLKIDGSFVRDALVDPNDAAIIQAVVALGRSLGLAVIAEGVETAAQRDFLARQGCHACQGYYFGRPGPIEALAPLLAAPT